MWHVWFGLQHGVGFEKEIDGSEPATSLMGFLYLGHPVLLVEVHRLIPDQHLRPRTH
jgi:hypothetical protein